MAFGPGVLLREYEFAVQQEATYGVSPGALTGANFFKHKTSLGVQRSIERYYRDQDRDNGQASVLNVQAGREKASVSIEADLIPAGAATPTKPDIDVLIMCAMGQKRVATAHTTLAAGSTTTVVNFTAGGVSASGTQVGDIIAIDIDGSATYEARQVTSITTDAVTLDRALTSAPAATRIVKVGVTYRLLNSLIITAYLWRFNNNNLRYVIPGVAIGEMDLSVNFADGTPVTQVKFNGDGQRQRPQTSTTRPTPTTVGVPLVPTVGKCWIAAVRYNVVNCAMNVKSGVVLRSTQSNQLYPDGAKRTGQNSRYEVNQTLELLATDVTQTIYDNAPSLTTQDVLMQIGTIPGNMVVWRTPNFRPDGDESEIDGEVGHKFSGRALGVTNDDEVTLAFL